MISFISINNSELIKKQQNVVFKQLFQASFLVLVLSTIIDYLNNSMTTAIVNTATTVFIFPLIYVLQKNSIIKAQELFFYSP